MKSPYASILASLSLLGTIPLHADQPQAQDPRLIWTAKKNAKVSFSVKIDGENHARVVIWRPLELYDGKFDKEQQIFAKDFTNAQAHPKNSPMVLLEEAVQNNSIKYRVEVFTSRTEAVEWKLLAGGAMKPEAVAQGSGMVFKFEDWFPYGEKNGDYDDIILTIREE